MFGLKRRRRAKLRTAPFPSEWRAIIARTVPYTRCLPPPLRAELEGSIQIFLAEKHFEGAGNLRITDTIRLTIAAQACTLLLGRDTDYYPALKTIIVYPHAYFVPTTSRAPDGTILEDPTLRLGESWHRGPVVLAWNDVLAGAADIHDGANVVFHEFAHQLDSESGDMDGAPNLILRSRYISWARVLTSEYNDLVTRLQRDEPTLIRAYAATNPPEFFAVVTELFFEKPEQLRARHPALYNELKSYYNQDPATWRCADQVEDASSPQRGDGM